MSGFLHVRDTRTPQTYVIQVVNNSVSGSDLAKIRGPSNVDDPREATEQQLRVFDPGYANTEVMRSRITFA